MESSDHRERHSCDIVIVGGGCSGALTAAQLLRNGFHGRLTIVEMRAALGRGLAYSTPFEQHLLNAPAGHMSAFPDEPAHFLEWLRGRDWGGAASGAFVPRKIYGEYIADVLQRAIDSSAGGNFRHLCGEAVDAQVDSRKVILRLRDGSTVEASRVVFALGNPASAPIENASTQTIGECWHESPWIGDALRVRFPGERILLVGTGLSAVDSVLALHGQSAPCVTYMVSRRGILPQVHDLNRAAGWPPVFEKPDNIRLMFRQLRAQITQLRDEDQCWRTAIDALRPVSNELWRGLPLPDRRRFLRHLKTYWEVHRHRMAPSIRQRIDELISQGNVTVIGGRIRQTERKGNAIEVTVSRARLGDWRLQVDRAINCGGIHEDYRQKPRRLIRALIENRLGRPNAVGLGFETGESGELIDGEGRRSTALFTLGPPRRGELFETTAVAEIRRQAEALARHLITT